MSAIVAPKFAQVASFTFASFCFVQEEVLRKKKQEALEEGKKLDQERHVCDY